MLVVERAPCVETTLGRWTLAHDPNATRRCYEPLPVGWGCACVPCRNFAALGEAAFTPAAHELLARLGVDYRKPAEIYHNARLESGGHSYGGWFHFVGRILSGADALKLLDISSQSGTFELEPMGENLQVGCSSHLALVRDSFAGQPVVQLEFSAELPWVVGEEPR
jgi:hypothetical protein